MIYKAKTVRYSICASLIAAFYFWPTYVSYQQLRLGYHDFGLMLHILNNIFVRGAMLRENAAYPFLEEHFAPFLYAYALPIHWFGPIAMLVMHSLAATVSCLLIYRIARHLGLRKPVALAATLLYTINPYTISIVRAVHWEVFVPMAVLLMSYLLLKQRWLWATVVCASALTLKEDAWLYLALAALATMPSMTWPLSRPSKKHMALVFLCLGYFAIVIATIYPLLWPERKGLSFWMSAYGNSDAAVIKQLLLQTPVMISKLWGESGLAFFSSLGLFAALLAPRRLVWVLPAAILWLNVPNPGRSALAFYYSYGLLGLMMLATLYGLKTAQDLANQMPTPKMRRMTIFVPMVLWLAAVARYQDQPPYFMGKLGKLSRSLPSPALTPTTASLTAIIANLNREPAAILTSFNLFGHLTQQPHATYVLFRDGERLLRGQIQPKWILIANLDQGPKFEKVLKEDFITQLAKHTTYKRHKTHPDIFLYERLDSGQAGI